MEGLTPRELDVARLAARRVRSREIAATLDLSVRTVDNHLARIFRKLGLSGLDETREGSDDEAGDEEFRSCAQGSGP